MNHIGEIIKKYRLMNDLTQEELGKKMYTNNWHNVQINININHDSVSQSVIYKTDNDIIEVIETNNKFDECNKTSVFRGGV